MLACLTHEQEAKNSALRYHLEGERDAIAVGGLLYLFYVRRQFRERI